MKSLVAPGRAKAPPHHEIAFGGVEVGFVEAAKQPLPWVVTSPFLHGLLRKQGLPLSIIGGRTVAINQWTLQH